MMDCGENYIAFVWKSMTDMLYHCRGLCLKSQINRVRYIMLNNKPKKKERKINQTKLYFHWLNLQKDKQDIL